MEEILELLVRLFQWPYEAWKSAIGNSRVGASPHEESAVRFWKGVAVVGVCLTIAVGAVIWWFFR